jgi:hypothetical protein
MIIPCGFGFILITSSLSLAPVPAATDKQQ